MSKPFKFLFICFIALQTLASIQCDHSKSKLITSEFYLKPPAQMGSINCNLVEKTHLLVDDISSIFGESPEIYLFLDESSYAASFDQGHILNVPQRFFRKSKKGKLHIKSGDKILPIIAHEYGHAIFTKKLSDNLPLLKPIIFRRAQISSKLRDVKQILEDVKNPNLTGQQRKLRLAQVQVKSKEISEIKKTFQSREIVQKVIKVIGPYHELFADIVSVYYYDDLEIMKETLSHPEYSESENNLVLRRSFSSHEHEIDENDLHGILGAVRSHIGQYYMPSNNNEKKLFLNTIFSAIKSEIRFQLNPLNSPLSSEKLNSRLINKIDTEFLKL